MNDIPPIARSKVMDRVFDFVTGQDVLNCQLVCQRWYDAEVPEYYKAINSLCTKLFKVGSPEQMIPQDNDHQEGFKSGSAAYSTHMELFRFQTGNWG